MARISQNKQLSFLDGELLNPDYVVRFGLSCFVCGRALSARVKTIYYLAGTPQRRLCKVCSKKYKQTFEIVKGGK